MAPWTPEDEERVNPTVRWLMRGAWKILFAIVVLILIGLLVEAVD